MNYEDLKYWIALKSVENLGNVGFGSLTEAFGSPKAVFEASAADIAKVPRIGGKIAKSIKAFDKWANVEKEFELADKSNVSIITSESPLYPEPLLGIYDPPPVLYVKGKLEKSDISVAVVGSRSASTYGKFTTQKLCRELALKGVTVVSGMARGIDSSAHIGSIAGKGRTIAVMGSGMDVIYPPENKKLFEKISESGAVITEFPFSTQPNGFNFPARNRIISGISLGVLVVEANRKSGSLITASLALEQGREVFAVPGSIDSPGSKGTHELIRKGAKLVENVYDILEEILPQADIAKHEVREDSEDPAKTDNSDLNDIETEILQLIGKTPIHIDDIISSTGRKANEILNILLSLEIRGHIRQIPGKRFALKE